MRAVCSPTSHFQLQDCTAKLSDEEISAIFKDMPDTIVDSNRMRSTPHLPRTPSANVTQDHPLEDDKLYMSMQVLADPHPKGFQTLKGELKRGQINVSAFVAADGPAALLDVLAEVSAKPKHSWLDTEVLDGALGALKELMNTADGAKSFLETHGAVDRLVGLLGLPEVRVRTKVLQLLACMVVYTDKPLVESALRRGARYGGASATSLLINLLKGDVEEQTMVEVMVLINALIACSTERERLVEEMVGMGLDDTLQAPIRALYQKASYVALSCLSRLITERICRLPCLMKAPLTSPQPWADF